MPQKSVRFSVFSRSSRNFQDVQEKLNYSFAFFLTAPAADDFRGAISVRPTLKLFGSSVVYVRSISTGFFFSSRPLVSTCASRLAPAPPREAWVPATSEATTVVSPAVNSMTSVRTPWLCSRASTDSPSTYRVATQSRDFPSSPSLPTDVARDADADPTLSARRAPPRPSFPISIVRRAAAAGDAHDHAGQPRSASAYPDPGNGERLVAMCPKCRSQLFVPPGVPTVACGSCGQAISPVVNGGYDNVRAPASAPTPVSGGDQMVKCPLCSALLQQPPGASLALCGGCHQVIGMPGAPGPQPSPQTHLPPIIVCPACSLQLQPPAGAPLVACGGCRKVMQVPWVEAAK